MAKHEELSEKFGRALTPSTLVGLEEKFDEERQRSF